MSKITKRKYVEQEVMEFVLPKEKQEIVKLTGGRGNNLHAVVNTAGEEFLVSMPNKFRKNIWVKRGDFVIIDPIEEGDKVRGEIAHVLFQDHIQNIQSEGLWPAGFEVEQKKATSYMDNDLLPPSDSEDEDDLAGKVVNANRGRQLYEEEDDDDSDEDSEDEEEEGEEEVPESEAAVIGGEDCDDGAKDSVSLDQR